MRRSGSSSTWARARRARRPRTFAPSDERRVGAGHELPGAGARTSGHATGRLTGKTILAFATGSTLIYFLQPAFVDGLVGLAFLLSLCTSRPAVARIAAEFYPMTPAIAAKPGIQKLFFRLTVLWAAICMTRAGITLWLMRALSMPHFVAAKTIYGPATVVLGAALTVVLASRVARREGLLPGHPLGAVALGGPA